MSRLTFAIWMCSHLMSSWTFAGGCCSKGDADVPIRRPSTGERSIVIPPQPGGTMVALILSDIGEVIARFDVARVGSLIQYRITCESSVLTQQLHQHLIYSRLRYEGLMGRGLVVQFTVSPASALMALSVIHEYFRPQGLESALGQVVNPVVPRGYQQMRDEQLSEHLLPSSEHGL